MFILRKVTFDNDLVVIEFETNGVVVSYPVSKPENWDTLTRAEKVAWGRQQLTDHLTSYNYQTAQELIFPDFDAQAQARSDLGGLPGWADWSGQQAADALKNAILNGMTKAETRAAIDAQFASATSFATLAAATIAVLKQLSDAVIDSRDVGHQNEARAIMYLRRIIVEE